MSQQLEEPKQDLEDALGRRIYHYRLAGESLDDIADKLSISRVRCATVFRKHLTALAKFADNEMRAESVRLDLDRLDTLMLAHWERATTEHEEEVVVGHGKDAYIDRITRPPDVNSAKMVLDILKHRAALANLTVPSPTDATVSHTVLVVGTNQAEFLRALQEGQRPALPSADPDNDIEGSAIVIEETQ